MGNFAEALACFEAGRFSDARDKCILLLEIEPAHGESLHMLGVLEQRAGRLESAAGLLHRAAVIHSNETSYHFNYGVVLIALRRLDEAARAFERVLELKPDHAAAALNLANVLTGLGLSDAAVVQYRAAIALNAGAFAHLNLGNLLETVGENEAALACFDAAVLCAPDLAQAHVNKGLNLLRAGQLLEGFREYEWRLLMEDFSSPQRNFAARRWRGESLQGQSILLHAEQGLGDCLQFLRYVPMVAACGGRVILEVPAAVKRIADRLQGVETIAFGSALPETDWECSLMSLPLVFGTTMDTIPRLNLPENLPQKVCRIGVVWAGNPAHLNDQNRSIPVEVLAPLFAMEGFQFYSLQMGKPAPADVADLTAGIADMDDVERVMGGLDLVITVDTAAAHLAGMMGKPVWILLGKHADWRWFEGRVDSPWYPTARLFRQERFGDWAGVVERVQKALADANIPC